MIRNVMAIAWITLVCALPAQSAPGQTKSLYQDTGNLQALLETKFFVKRTDVSRNIGYSSAIHGNTMAIAESKNDGTGYLVFMFERPQGIGSDWLLTCQRYIEMNPVRAGMVSHPGEYIWSSYRVNGQEEPFGLVTPHPLYHDLGRDETERSSAYRELFRHELEPGEIDKIRKATNGNFALGSSRFQEEISAMLGRRVTPGRAGRLRKANYCGAIPRIAPQ